MSLPSHDLFRRNGSGSLISASVENFSSVWAGLQFNFRANVVSTEFGNTLNNQLEKDFNELNLYILIK